jgi:uncharacterized membrane protein YqiK
MNFSRLTPAFTYLSRYAYIITLVFICALLTILMWFLYVRVYQTLTQAELVVELKGHVSTQTLQVEQHQNVLDKIKTKSTIVMPTIVNTTLSTSTASTTPDQRKNPFRPLQ